jgi:SAM-dependent methyltransferase
MTIGERLLLLFSRPPDSQDYLSASPGSPGLDALQLLERVIPNFEDRIRGKRVVDFGCGAGNQCIALASRYGCTVVGVDSNRASLQAAEASARAQGISSGQLSFVEGISPSMSGQFDFVISQNSFEHFADPAATLDEMASLLSQTGELLISFGPPWFAPYGSHMHFFCKLPWVNLLFPEKTVMNVRRRFRNDGARTYEEVESGLNRMTVRKFEAIALHSGLNITYRDYECVKGIRLFARIPLLRELFINHITAVMSRS